MLAKSDKDGKITSMKLFAKLEMKTEDEVGRRDGLQVKTTGRRSKEGAARVQRGKVVIIVVVRI